MTNRSDSKVWNEFMSSEFAQSEIKKMKKEAFGADVDRNKLYGPAADPKNNTTLSESFETQGVAAGGASIVGGGDSKALYTVKSVPVPGGQEACADAVVEGLEDIQKVMMEVAMREATGKPFGTQDNVSEKWDGIQAAGRSIKPFSKAGQMNPVADPEMMMAPMMEEEDENQSIEDILAELEGGEEHEEHEEIERDKTF